MQNQSSKVNRNSRSFIVQDSVAPLIVCYKILPVCRQFISSMVNTYFCSFFLEKCKELQPNFDLYNTKSLRLQFLDKICKIFVDLNDFRFLQDDLFFHCSTPAQMKPKKPWPHLTVLSGPPKKVRTISSKIAYNAKRLFRMARILKFLNILLAHILLD